MVIKEGSGMYGRCWIEQKGTMYYVYIENGRSVRGPFGSLTDADREFSRWC